jgi:hypothetical protein
MPTPFTTKINKRAIGSEVPIADEPHTIPPDSPYSFRLIEVPLLDLPDADVTIPGYTKVEGIPGPNQFQVDFTIGKLSFNSANAEDSVLVSYVGMGSEIDAEDINEVQTNINAIESEIETARGSQDTLGERLDYSLKDSGDIKDYFIKPIHISNEVTDDFVFPNKIKANNLMRPGIFADDPDVTVDDIGSIFYNTTDNQFKGVKDDGVGNPIIILLG